MQDFSIGRDSDCDPLIEMYVLEMEICPRDRDPHLGKGSKSESESVETCSAQSDVAIGFGVRVRIFRQWK